MPVSFVTSGILLGRGLKQLNWRSSPKPFRAEMLPHAIQECP